MSFIVSYSQTNGAVFTETVESAGVAYDLAEAWMDAGRHSVEVRETGKDWVHAADAIRGMNAAVADLAASKGKPN